MRYHPNVLSLIGNTPLVKLNKVTEGVKPLVLAKCEFMNPGGSVKDRIGPGMIEAAEKAGDLKPGGTIVEGTSGNTGVGLALAAALKGYRTVFTMADKQSREKQLLLKAFGARVVVCPTAVAPEDPRSYYSVAKRIHNETPNSIYPNQYYNQANPQAHYESTGPEIWRDTEGKVTHYFVALGTGGTISGAGKYLKEQNPGVKVIGVDPEGSILREYKETGEYHPENARSYLTEGIGEDIIPGSTWFEYIDEMVTVSDAESFHMARDLARKEGLFSGGSAGTAVAGVLKYIKEKNLGPDAVCVVILPDSGTRYITKFYSDEWMAEQGFLEAEDSVGRLVQSKGGPSELISVAPDETMRAALQRMGKHGVSQVPVIDKDGHPIGSLSEDVAMARALERPAIMDEPVHHAMEETMPSLESGAPVSQAVRLLKSHAGVLVKRDGKLAGILSRYDVLAHLAGR